MTEEATAPEAPETEATGTTETPADAQAEGGESTPEVAGEMPKGLLTGEVEEAAPKAASEAPEDYEPFDLGEGFNLGSKELEGFSATAKELGLSQEKAQKMMTQFASMQKSLNQDLTRQAATKWQEQVQSDPELGGQHFKENIATANRAVKQFASPELVGLLNSSGLGNHPEIVRLFVKVGKAISQDKGVVGEASAPSAPRRRFPNSDMVADFE